MAIDIKKALEGLGPYQKLSRGNESISLSPDGDPSYTVGNVVLHGDEALVLDEEGSKLFRLRDGKIVGGLFVDTSGAERELAAEEAAKSAPVVESAMGLFKNALEHPQEFEVKDLFEE